MRLSRRQLLAATAGGAAWAATGLAAETGTVLDAADVHVADYPTVAGVRWLGAQLESATAGRLRIRQFHSGQLGREADTLSLTRMGALALTRVTVATVNNAFPQTALLSLPYVFDDTAHLRRALDGEPGRRIRASFKARGLTALCYYDAGVRCIYNTRRPVVAPEHLHGLKLRVPPSDIFMALMRAYGVNATPLSYGEVYSALQTHLIDGAENNWPSFHSSRQFEVARYWSETQHSLAPEVLLLSAKVDARLAPGDRELLRDLALRSVPVMRALWDARVDAARTAAIAGGVLVNDVDHDAFRAAAAPLLQQQLADPAIAALHRSIRALSVDS
jgi:tripartite ATP-independent transporter DctP family solute receptor